MSRQLSLIHLVREPSVPAAAGVSPLLLLLHGIGSNEADLFGLAPYLDERLRIVSARAPIALGPGAFGWFNIEFTPTGLVADLAQAEQSRALLATFIAELLSAYPTPARRIYLMGFSQGAMMSLSLLLAQADKVAGVVAMSGRLPTQALALLRDPQALAGLPVLVTHGVYDPVLPIEAGRDIRAQLAALPVALTYREYPMGHEVTPESLRDAAAWLTTTLNAAEAAPGTSAG